MAFINFKNEDAATRLGAGIAIAITTVGIATVSIGGAIASSSGDYGLWVLRIAFSVVIMGIEILAAVSLSRIMRAPNMTRRIIGFLIFFMCAWVCVQNAKQGVHIIMPEQFGQNSTVLAAKSKLAGEKAEIAKGLTSSAVENAPKELERVRTEIADNKSFLMKMSAMSPEGIKEAQSEMIGRCGYTGSVDGIRSTRTESAMRSCGERIQRQMDILQAREAALTSGVPVTTAGPSDEANDPAIQQIELAAAAEDAFWAAIWLEVMLWAIEGARSFGLWVFVTNETGRQVGAVRKIKEDIELAKLEQELAAIRGGPVHITDPVKDEPPPENDAPEENATDAPIQEETKPPEEPEPTLTKEQLRARKGGQAAQHGRRAARNEKKIPVTDDRDEDEMFL